LAARLFLLLAITLAATFGAYTLLSLRTTRAQWEEMVHDHAQQLSDVILSSTRYSMLLNRKEDVHHTIEAVAAAPEVENVRVYDKLGVIISSAQPEEIGRSVDLKAEACVSCHTGPRPLQTVPVAERTRIFSRPGGGRVLGLISPIPNAPDCSTAACHAHPAGQSVLGVLDVTMSLAENDAQLALIERDALAAAIAFAVLAALVSAVFLARVVRRPVRALICGARRVASGDLTGEIQVRRGSEMGELALAFNNMTRDLARARQELTEWSKRLETNLQEKTSELGRTQRQIAHMDKMASLGRLAAMVAHELNNPLAGIVGYSRLVQRTLREGALPETERAELLRYLEAIQKEAARSGDIVRNLVAFARPSGQAFRAQSLAPVIERALMLVGHSLAMAQVKVEAAAFEGDDVVSCDADQVQQALVALLVNAVEAMPSGGTLKIRASGSADSVRIEIQDSGCGIAKEALPHLFEPFFTSKEASGGAGLGLAVVYGIVRRHGGSIEVDSEVGRGTTFRITLPRERADGALDDARPPDERRRPPASAAPARSP
jgi:two-component system NtrC family sensor kinase